jgi:flagellar hook protein FlgE
MSMNIALSGLKAATTDLGVVSNNIANANTTGFKLSRAEFGDMVSGNSANSPGMGVQLEQIGQQFKQGSVSSTGKTLDLAINGEGFFSVKQDGAALYTRAGIFDTDSDGFVVNSLSQNLQGYGVDAMTGNLTSIVGDLRVDTADMQPTATTLVEAGVNLDANAIVPTVSTFDPANPNSFNSTTSLTVYDSLGNSNRFDLYFIKNATVLTWDVRATRNGGEPFTTAPPVAPTIYTPAAVAPSTLANLQFNSSGLPIDSDPSVPGSQPIKLGFSIPATDLANGAAALDITVDFGDTTQFGGPFSPNSLTQDGYAKGRLTGINVDKNGELSGRYNNGQSKLMGQVVLANFASVQGLQPVGDTNWIETSASGPALVGAPQTGTLGKLVPGALEASNVDLTEQLVNMISAQRNFQANTQVINTNGTLYQAILNIR